MNIIRKLARQLRSLRYWVLVDPADNSVTLSPQLLGHMRRTAPEATAVFVFRAAGTFGFMPDTHAGLDPGRAQLCYVQYNERYRCVGFETLCPSVGRILYDFHLPALRPVRLSVRPARTPKGQALYLLDPPPRRKSCPAT